MGCDDLDVDLVAMFDFEGNVVEVDVEDAEWNYWERVKRLMDRHSITQAEAERVTRTVIAEKEHDPGVEVSFVSKIENDYDF